VRVSGRRDVVVVGGGPAGLTTALAIAHASPDLAARVLVLEKGRYPRDKFCAGAFGMRGEAILAAMNAVPRVPSVEVDGVSFRAREGEIVTRVGGIGRVVRRLEFDHALARLARDRGVEVRDGVRVEAVERAGSGVTVATDEGPMEAAVVVGADGVGSLVRKALGLGGGKLRAQVLELDTEPVPGERDRALLHFDFSDRRLTGYAWDFPTVVGGEALVCRGVYWLRLGGADVDLHALLAARLARMGLDVDRYKNKRFAERGYDPPERLASGPLMLVGEAAGIDPVSGEGIAQAIEYGALAGRFLASTLASGTTRVDGWTREVERSRLARDLRIRRAFMDLFYGDRRPAVERFVLDCPEFLHVGCQHFAAQSYDRGKLAWALVRGALAYAWACL
jgi:flavin-dependent dehydrogenase